MLCRLLVLYLVSVNTCLIGWSNTVQVFVLLTQIQLYNVTKHGTSDSASELRDGRPLFGGAPLIL